MDARTQRPGWILQVTLAALAVVLGLGHVLWRWIRFDDIGSAGLVVAGLGVMILLGARRKRPAA